MNNSGTHKKTISQKIRYGGNVVDTTIKILSEKQYTTGSENIILVKSVDNCEIILDSTNTNHLIIKSLTNTLLKPSFGEIDEYYDEILMEKGSCVELLFIDGFWYIISSDGLKFN
jgi:hypothetical protein